MNLEIKTNLSQIFRQAESTHHVDQSGQEGDTKVPKAYSLRSTSTPFVVDQHFALQLDEII
ncbi:hypothetical protein [Polynucleobacter arcticus]|uniref:Uncharacterized protein n=1 Tax=Polynucleobacter arcticus TaxID=1743165 RepID=A0A6M9PWX1_9BURK|nr:hypothetical protein [Polynucleobacter arcticus]QKM60423.1 hypothetical protein DN92_04840 [Polynucleobacter arcticus]